MDEFHPMIYLIQIMKSFINGHIHPCRWIKSHYVLSSKLKLQAQALCSFTSHPFRFTIKSIDFGNIHEAKLQDGFTRKNTKGCRSTSVSQHKAMGSNHCKFTTSLSICYCLLWDENRLKCYTFRQKFQSIKIQFEQISILHERYLESHEPCMKRC